MVRLPLGGLWTGDKVGCTHLKRGTKDAELHKGHQGSLVVNVGCLCVGVRVSM